MNPTLETITVVVMVVYPPLGAIFAWAWRQNSEIVRLQAQSDQQIRELQEGKKIFVRLESVLTELKVAIGKLETRLDP